MSIQGFSATWYSAGSGNADDLTSWWSISGGGGSNPTTFLDPGDVWYMESSLISTTSAWTIGGTLNIADVSFYSWNTSINIGGDLNVSGNAYIAFQDFTSLNLSGNLFVTDAAMFDNPGYSSWLHLNNTSSSLSAPQTITWTSIDSSLYLDITIDAGCTAKLLSNLPLPYYAISGSFVSAGLTVNGTLICGNYVTSDLGGTDVFRVNSGGTIYTTNVSGLDGISTASSNSYDGGANYHFNGTSAQITGYNFPANLVTPGSINIDNAAGLTLIQSLTIGAGASFNFTSGNLVIGANTLTINGTLSGMSPSNVFTCGTGSNLTYGGAGYAGVLFLDQTIDGITNNVDVFNMNMSSSGMLSLGNNMYSRTSLNLTSGQLMLNGQTLTLNGTFSGDATNNLSCISGSIINVNGAGALGTLFFDQTIPGFTNVLSSFTINRIGGSAALGNNLSINGNLNLSAGSLNDGGNTVDLAGNITGTGTHTSTGIGSIRMLTGGTGISGASIGNLELNHPSGFNLTGDPTIMGNLLLTSGNLNVGAHILTLDVDATVSGSFTGANMIAVESPGNVKHNFGNSSSYYFPIGDNSGNFTPIALDYLGGVYPGANALVNVNPSKPGANANASNFINRYWNVNVSGPSTPVWAVISAEYVPADVAGTEANISMGQFTGTLPWTKYGVTNTTTHTLSSGYFANGVSVFTGITTAGPLAISSPDASICIGSSTSLSGLATIADPAVTYSWIPATGLSAVTGGVVIATPLSNTTYTLTVTDGNGYTSTTTTSFIIKFLPLTHSITGGGSLCTGAAGRAIGLDGTESGIYYQLNRGFTTVGSPVLGAGGALSFGLIATGGSYNVVAIDTITGCTNNMSGSVNVIVNPLPTLYNVTGGGNYCSGGAGVPVGLSYSSTGVDYQLYSGGTLTGSPISGAGSVLDFGLQTFGDTYTIVARDTTTGCTTTMTGSATVVVNPLPVVYTVINGGGYCAGGTGATINISGSDTGIGYQLYYLGSPVGSLISGTGSILDMGAHAGIGAYTATAKNNITACISTMSASATVFTIALPNTYHVTGGGSYCAGGTGVAIGLDSSNNGVNYQLYLSSTIIGANLSGAEAALSFGLDTLAGTYTVIATDTTTHCSNMMTGSATVVITPLVNPSVTINSSGADTLCAGTLVHFNLSTSHAGISPRYLWKVNGSTVDTLSTHSYIPSNADIVSVIMYSSEACASPDSAINAMDMRVLPNGTPTVATASDKGTVICDGTPVTFTATSTFGGPSPAYTWVVNGFNSGTGTSYSFTPANGDIVYCTLVSDYMCRLSTVVSSANTTMTVDTPIIPIVAFTTSGGALIGTGHADTITAIVTNGGTSPTYQWVKNGVVIPGASTATYYQSSFTNHDSLSCIVTRNDACALSSFNSVIINVGNVGINNIANANNIAVMPNPNNGEFTIKGQFGNIDQELSLEITNMLGQVVYTSQINSQNGMINQKVILASSLGNGVYNLSLHSATEASVFQMVIAR